MEGAAAVDEHALSVAGADVHSGGRGDVSAGRGRDRWSGCRIGSFDHNSCASCSNLPLPGFIPSLQEKAGNAAVFIIQKTPIDRRYGVFKGRRLALPEQNIFKEMCKMNEGPQPF